MLLSALGLAVLCSSMADIPLMSVDRATVLMALSETPVSAAWKVRIAALALCVIAAIALDRGRVATIISTILGSIALGSLAWGGHGAAGEGTGGSIQLGGGHRASCCAGLWIGGLAGFCMLLFYPPTRRDGVFVRSMVGTVGGLRQWAPWPLQCSSPPAW